MLSEFPEELLEALVECVAFNGDFIQRQTPTLHENIHLVSLSMTSRQLRRIAFPFLFAHIEIQTSDDVKRLLSQCIANEFFARSVRILDVNRLLSKGIISRLLPRLPNLSLIISDQIPLYMSLFNAIKTSNHPVPTICYKTLSDKYFFGHNQPLVDPSDPLVLSTLQSKITFDTAGINFIEANGLRGIRVRRLDISHPRYLPPSVESFESHKYPGLCELAISDLEKPISLSWLPEFASGHPSLKKISFRAAYPSHIAAYYSKLERTGAHIDPFMESFLRNVYDTHFSDNARYGNRLGDTMEIKGFAITRTGTRSTGSSADPFSEWYVTGIYLSISKWFSGRLFHIMHSSFPQLSVLTIDTEDILPPRPTRLRYAVLGDDGSCPVDELIDSLHRFSSLKVVTFMNPINLLGFTSKDEPTPEKVEAAIIRYTSRIAEGIPTIEAFFIHRLGAKSNKRKYYLQAGISKVGLTWRCMRTGVMVLLLAGGL
ncbi:hypothetical protein BT96DRAFT_999088 [Gymnopus androsaceus JB14]|uniref:Uncharacterized protein n=1 Tax=Gymnopus androsaceus JB14 TaxID=1447944 RepID=A0A6A4H7X8_9AGAR|nr:hypothetical protein BT96DRAFT_999088 [Gymnopus androsaceus JB14]